MKKSLKFLLAISLIASFFIGKNTNKTEVKNLNITSNIIIKNKEYIILFNGTPEELKNSKYLNCEVLEVSGCEDELYKVCIFVDE